MNSFLHFAMLPLIAVLHFAQPARADYVPDAHAGIPNSQLNDAQQGARGDFCMTSCGNATGTCYNKCLENGVVDRSTASPSESPAPQTCSQRLSWAITACTNDTTAATNSCDESQDSGMSQAQQAAVVLGQQVSSSVLAACSTMGKISQAANAATAAYQMNCSSAVSDCTSSCQSAIKYFQDTQGCASSGGVIARMADLRDTQKRCTDLTAKSQAAQQAIQNFINTTAQAQNCETQSDGTSAPVPEVCKANPNIAGCSGASIVDCTKPEMASNKVCVCSKNPNDPSCMSAQNSNNNVTSGSSTMASRTGTGADPLAGGDDNFGLPEIQQGARNTGGLESAVDGKQGAGANISGGGGDAGSGSGAGGKNGAAKGEDPLGVNAGFYGSGGGSSGAGGAGAGVGSGGDREGGPLKDFVGLAEKAVKGLPNLRQFLPGGALDPKARGLAGAAGPDGITGPNSNIWQKIQNRYQVVAPSLMP